MDKQLDLSNTKVYSSTKEDAIKALSLIGQDVWQDVYMSDYEDFCDYSEGKLVGVSYIRDSDYTKYPFICEICGIERSSQYKYFILKKDAKFKEEKKLRPFETISEFSLATGCEELGDTIIIKMINGKFEEKSIFNGYRILTEKNLKTIVFLGVVGYTLEELKEDYLYFKDGKWHPFGIEE